MNIAVFFFKEVKVEDPIQSGYYMVLDSFDDDYEPFTRMFVLQEKHGSPRKSGDVICVIEMEPATIIVR